jgi:hypothetical protein
MGDIERARFANIFYLYSFHESALSFFPSQWERLARDTFFLRSDFYFNFSKKTSSVH